jgi:predicted ATPase
MPQPARPAKTVDWSHPLFSCSCSALFRKLQVIVRQIDEKQKVSGRELNFRGKSVEWEKGKEN